MSDLVRIRRAVLERLLEEARRSRNEECCGLLAGREGTITEVLAARNQLASATAYEIAPADLFRSFKQIRVAGLQHLGIYHSHLAGPNVPSPKDIEQAFYPDVAYFIVALEASEAQAIRAFRICEGTARELKIVPD